jgi:hypothetical protein
VLKKKAAIGDILEIKTPSGLAYLQYTHEHPDMGALVRVLPGLYERRPTDFTELAQQKELYFTYYVLEYALPKGETEVVSHQPIPDWARSYPMMRHSLGGGTSGTWTILRADMLPLTLENIRKSPKYTVLTPEQEKLSIDSIWSHGLLVERLAQGWMPERAEEFLAAARKKAEKKPRPKPVPNQAMRHYLYFPEKENAEKAAQWFRAQGFSVDVQPGAGNENWLALVKHEIVDDQQDLERIREEMEALTERLDGEYDGWEVAL